VVTLKIEIRLTALYDRDDAVPIDISPLERIVSVESYEQAKQIAREINDHFQQVANENPAARAVADALAHEQSGIGTITIQQDFTTSNTDPDDFYKEIVKMNATGGPHGTLR
jgi:hypothetical protein